MNRRPAIGRGDLIRALANTPVSARAKIAAACGCIADTARRPAPTLIVRTVQDANPEPRVPILVMGDLGRCSHEAALRAGWLAYGRELSRRGNTLCALLPCPRDRWDAELAALWRSGCWNHGERLPRQGQRATVPLDDAVARERTARVETLLTLLSPAVRVEPGLLRLLSRLCGAGAGVKFDVWNHAEVARTPLAIALYPEAALRRRAAFSRVDNQTKYCVRQLRLETGCGEWQFFSSAAAGMGPPDWPGPLWPVRSHGGPGCSFSAALDSSGTLPDGIARKRNRASGQRRAGS